MAHNVGANICVNYGHCVVPFFVCKSNNGTHEKSRCAPGSHAIVVGDGIKSESSGGENDGVTACFDQEDNRSCCPASRVETLGVALYRDFRRRYGLQRTAEERVAGLLGAVLEHGPASPVLRLFARMVGAPADASGEGELLSSIGRSQKKLARVSVVFVQGIGELGGLFKRILSLREIQGFTKKLLDPYGSQPENPSLSFPSVATIRPKRKTCLVWTLAPLEQVAGHRRLHRKTPILD